MLEMVLEAPEMVLLVRVSVVARPTKVSSASGMVMVLVVPVVIPESWSFKALVTSRSSTKEVVESARDLFVRVWVSVVPTTVPVGAVLPAQVVRLAL